jgi:hypothetical protein
MTHPVTSRSLALRLALAADGVPPRHADCLVARLGRIAKRKGTRSAVKSIDRERKVIRTARAKIAKLVGTFLADQAAPIAAQVTTLRDAAEKAAKGALAKMSTDEAKALASTIAQQLDLADWAALVPAIEKILFTIVDDGISVAFDQIGVIPSTDITDQVNAAAVAFARDRAAELVGMKYNADGELVTNPNAVWAITDATRDMLRGEIAEAIEDGTSTADFADALEELYAFSEARADTIARTEIARADVEGNLTAYRDSGIVEGKEWILGSEHEDIDCECEDAAAMGVVPLDDDWGGIGDPPAHPNCVCDVLPVLAGEDAA